MTTVTKYVAPQRDVDLQGHYAGMVSRFVAYLIDVALSSLLFGIGTWLVVTALEVVTGHDWDVKDQRIVIAVLWWLWFVFYYAAPLAATGRTAGMAVLGLQVRRADGHELGPWRALARTLVFPLSFLVFGIGLLWGLVQREHRCLHDLIAGTCVVYSWDARAARRRLLARPDTTPDPPA